MLVFLSCLGAPFAWGGGGGAPSASSTSTSNLRTWNEGGQLDDDEIAVPLSGVDLDLGTPCKHDPSNWLLLGVGLAFAPVAYELGVMWHEGSHAAWATAFGARVTGWYPYPKVIPGNGFVFGYTTWVGQMSDTQLALTYVAPKITDLTLLTAYTITNETGNLPENKWAQLAIDSLAAAAVIDLGHDVFQTNPYGDVPEFYKNAHITNTIPGRMIQGGLTLAGAAEVGHGIYKLFQPTPPPKKKDEPAKRVTAFSDFSVSPYIGTETLGLSGTF